MAERKLKIGKQIRGFQIDREAVDKEKRLVPLSFSSEEPVERWFGMEILDHSTGALNLKRLKTGGALLIDHNTRDQVGVIEDVSVDADRKGRAVVRFGRSAKAEEIFTDVLEGIRQNVSVGYQIDELMLEKEEKGQPPVYRAVKWTPYEISLVSVPADITVGVGRQENLEGEGREFKIQIPDETTVEPKTKQEERKMADIIEINEAREKAKKEEQQRTADLLAIGKAHNCVELAEKCIMENRSVDELKSAVLEKLNKKPPIDTSIDMSDKEARRFSFVRAIHALANPSDRRAQEDAQFEFEASMAVAKKLGRSARGVFVPREVQKRDLVVGTASAGGNLVATDLLAASFIELLRNKMLIKQLGATVLDGLVGNVAIPKQTGGATAYWVAENAAPTESQQVVGQITMSPKSVGAFTDLARKLLLQSSIDVENFVRTDLATVLALAIDLAAINGSGTSNQPTGILSTSGIGDVAGGTNGAAPTYPNMVELETDVSAANADVAGMSILTTPEMRGKLKQTVRFSSTNTPIWENNTVNGYPAAVSNQVPKTLTKGTSTDCHAIIFGNWKDIIVGQWGVLDILVDPYTGGAAGTVRVRVLQDVDIAIRHAESFSVMKDARNI